MFVCEVGKNVEFKTDEKPKGIAGNKCFVSLRPNCSSAIWTCSKAHLLPAIPFGFSVRWNSTLFTLQAGCCGVSTQKLKLIKHSPFFPKLNSIPSGILYCLSQKKQKLRKFIYSIGVSGAARTQQYKRHSVIVLILRLCVFYN